MLLLSGISCFQGGAYASAKQWVDIPAGAYEPLFSPSEIDPKGLRDSLADKKAGSSERATKVKVAAFRMQIDPVTNADFLAFVQKNPEWRRDRIKAIFSDRTYLRHWKDDAEIGKDGVAKAPVGNVSWFAAKAYCHWLDARLPSTDEWEYVASLDEAAKRDDVILNWYSQTNESQELSPNPSFLGKMGVRSMYGKIWEWTLDFNSSFVTGESREDSSLSRSMFCGAGSVGATKPNEYATFMRYAFRSSLKSNYTLPLLGFRCAKDRIP